MSVAEPSPKPNLYGRPRERVWRPEGFAGETGSEELTDCLPCALIIIALCLCMANATPLALASGSEFRPASADVQRLMRNVTWNELQARKNRAHQYECDFREETPQGSRTFLQIETKQGTVERLIEVNGKPPSEGQCHKNIILLNRIASDPQLQQSRLRSQRADLARRAQLFAVMADAFLFRMEGTEKDTGWLRIAYSPNPQFHPRGRVGGLLVGLQGTLWVDRSAQRLVRIRGRLVRNVTFGWGILARLNRGGEFVLDQSRLPDGTWHEKVLQVRFQGTILLVKKLNVDMKDTFSSYQDIPDGFTLIEAIRRLERVHVNCGGG